MKYCAEREREKRRNLLTFFRGNDDYNAAAAVTVTVSVFFLSRIFATSSSLPNKRRGCKKISNSPSSFPARYWISPSERVKKLRNHLGNCRSSNLRKARNQVNSLVSRQKKAAAKEACFPLKEGGACNGGETHSRKKNSNNLRFPVLFLSFIWIFSSSVSGLNRSSLPEKRRKSRLFCLSFSAHT